jgi:RNA polymerase sigma factor (sigma-70 family)
MDSELGSRTSTTLLGRLRGNPTDEAAWAEFVARYGKKIYGWCRRWHLQDADAADVTQAVLLKLAREMRTFDYNPAGSFRGWLKTLSHHAWQDLVQRRRHLIVAGGGQVEEQLHSLEARDDLAARIKAALDAEVFDQAVIRVRLRVHPRTWQAFQLTALEGLTGPKAAARLGISLSNVYKAKSNVQKLLQQEIRYVERSMCHEHMPDERATGKASDK